MLWVSATLTLRPVARSAGHRLYRRARRFNRPRAALVSTIFGALARDENANRQPKNLEDRDLGTWKAALASFVSL